MYSKLTATLPQKTNLLKPHTVSVQQSQCSQAWFELRSNVFCCI